MSFLPGLFSAGLRPGDVMVQASMALPICRKILEGRLTIVSPTQQTPEEVVEEEETLLNSRLSPIPLEFDPWLVHGEAVRLSGVPPNTPLALIKTSLRGEGVLFWWVSWSATPGEVIVEPRSPDSRDYLLRRGLGLYGGGPRLRARPAHDEELGFVARSVSAPEGLLEATRCKPFPDSCFKPPMSTMTRNSGARRRNFSSRSQNGLIRPSWTEAAQ